MKKLYLLFFMLLISTPCFSQDIMAVKSNSSFQEIAHIDKLEKISVNDVPFTTYTPKNLRTQTEVRFQGRNTTSGAMTVWSKTFTDYDTKIVESQEEDNDFYIIDNTGKKFKTGEKTNLAPINDDLISIHNDINNSNESIIKNKKDIDILNQKMNDYKLDIGKIEHRMNKLEHKMDSGFATMTAISGLKPNPRSSANGELAISVGTYNNKSAIATGLFYHVNNNIMLHGGMGYSDNNSTAGYGGATFNLF